MKDSDSLRFVYAQVMLRVVEDTPPLRLYLIFSLLFFVVAAWAVGQGVLLHSGQTLEADAPGQARFISDDLPRLMFLFLPVFALLLKVAFRHRLYFDHLIHSLHIHSAAYVVLIFVLPMEDLANRLWWALVLQFSLTFYLLAYLVISLQHVYGASWRGTAAKAFCILFVYMTLIAAASEALRHLTMSGSDAGRFSLSEDQSQNNQPALPIAWR